MAFDIGEAFHNGGGVEVQLYLYTAGLNIGRCVVSKCNRDSQIDRLACSLRCTRQNSGMVIGNLLSHGQNQVAGNGEYTRCVGGGVGQGNKCLALLIHSV